MELPAKGPLPEVGFIKLLLDSMEAKRTGMIRLENGPVIKVVYIQQGNVAFASSNEKTDRLTEVLKRAGKLTPEQIEHAQARLRPNVSLGKTLVELGYISPKDLLWGARMQVESILHQLLFWSKGNYQVIEGPLPKEIVSLNMAVPQILFDGILKSRDRDWVLQHIGSPETVFQLDPGFHEKNAQYKLPVEDTVSRINGKRSLEEIAQATGQDTFDVCKAMAALQLLNMVQKAPSKETPEPMMVGQVAQEQEGAPPFELTPVMPRQDLSLGQVLQIPTVEQLERESKEELAEEEEPAEPTFILPPPAAAQTLPPFFEPTPPARSEEPETAPVQPFQEEEEDTETLNESETPKKPQPKPWQPPIPTPRPASTPTLKMDPEPTERFSSAPVADREERAFPMESLSRAQKKSKKSPYKEGMNWKKLALIMVIVASLAIAITFLYTGVWSTPPQREYPETNPPKPFTRTTPKPDQKPPVVVQPAPVITKPVPDQKQNSKPVVTPPPVVKPAPVVAASTPLGMLKAGRISDAARAWKKSLLPKASRYTIQLEIACQEGTVLEAFQILHDSPELAVVPLDYKGKSCFRVLYGVYPSQADAQASRARLPQDFLKQQSPAQVIPVAKALK